MISFTYEDQSADVGMVASPLMEAVVSLQVLIGGRARPHLREWADSARSALRGDDISLLLALIPPVGYVPDFLTPQVDGSTRSIDDELELVRETPESLVAEEVSFVDVDELTSPSWRSAAAKVRAQILSNPARAVAVLVEQLHKYFETVLADYWLAVNAALKNETRRRHDQLDANSLPEVMNSLSPQLVMTGNKIAVQANYTYSAEIDTQRLLLVPSVFRSGAPAAMLPPYSPAIVYPISTDNVLYLRRRDHPRELEQLIGRVRAAVLSSLTRPISTTELAMYLAVTPGCVSQHLGVLRSTGLVTSRREGQSVLYRRTELGEALLGVR
jgi:DNA-binding transcriptional ArsR family regulator